MAPNEREKRDLEDCLNMAIYTTNVFAVLMNSVCFFSEKFQTRDSAFTGRLRVITILNSEVDLFKNLIHIFVVVNVAR